MPGGRPHGRRPRFITGDMYVPELVDDEGDDEISRVLKDNAASMNALGLGVADAPTQPDLEGQPKGRLPEVVLGLGSLTDPAQVSEEI